MGITSPHLMRDSPDDSPRSVPPHSAPGARAWRSQAAAVALNEPIDPAVGRDADRLPDRRRGNVLRRLRRPARPGTPRRERHPDDLAIARRRGRGREDQVLDDVRTRRLHALPLRRERHDLSLHPPQQRSDGESVTTAEACVPGVAYAKGLKDGATRQGRAADRLQRRLRRRRGDYHLHFEVHPKDGDGRQPASRILNEATTSAVPRCRTTASRR